MSLPYAKRMTSLLVKYHDRILVHATGHDHHSDIRYHIGPIPEDLLEPGTLEYIQDYQGKKNETIDTFVFNNMVLTPAITSIDGTNPGFSSFEFNRAHSTLFNLEMHFLRIESTYNMTLPLPALSDPKFRFVDFYWDENFKLANLTGAGMVSFMTYLMGYSGEEELIDLLGDKAGFDPDDAAENMLIQQIYKNDGFIGDSSTRARVYCIMARGLHIDEVRDCIKNYKQTRQAVTQIFLK